MYFVLFGYGEMFSVLGFDGLVCSVWFWVICCELVVVVFSELFDWVCVLGSFDWVVVWFCVYVDVGVDCVVVVFVIVEDLGGWVVLWVLWFGGFYGIVGDNDGRW